MKNKFIGTIIDDNYWKPWVENGRTYRMCMSCSKPQLVREGNRWMIGKKHYCEGDAMYWVDLACSHNQGFIFIPAK